MKTSLWTQTLRRSAWIGLLAVVCLPNSPGLQAQNADKETDSNKDAWIDSKAGLSDKLFKKGDAPVPDGVKKQLGDVNKKVTGRKTISGNDAVKKTKTGGKKYRPGSPLELPLRLGPKLQARVKKPARGKSEASNLKRTTKNEKVSLKVVKAKSDRDYSKVKSGKDYSKVNSRISTVGKALAIVDAYAEEEAAAKREGRPFSQANMTVNAALNLTGITAAWNAEKATINASKDQFKKSLEKYKRLGYDLDSPRVRTMIVMEAIARGTAVGTYQGAKVLPGIGDAISCYELAEASIGLTGDLYNLHTTRVENKIQQGQNLAQAISGARAMAKTLSGIAQRAKIQAGTMEKLFAGSMRLRESLPKRIVQYRKEVDALKSLRNKAETIGKASTTGALGDEAVGKLAAELDEITKAAEKHVESAGNVLAERTAGKLSEQAFQTQAGFIISLFERTQDRYGRALKTLGELEALSGADETLQQIQAARAKIIANLAIMQSMSGGVASATSAFDRASAALTETIKLFNEQKARIRKGTEYFLINRTKVGSQQANQLERIRSRVASTRIDKRTRGDFSDKSAKMHSLLDSLSGWNKEELPPESDFTATRQAGEAALRAMETLKTPAEQAEQAMALARKQIEHLKSLIGELPETTATAKPKPKKLRKLSKKQLENLTWKKMEQDIEFGFGSKDKSHPPRFGFEWHEATKLLKDNLPPPGKPQMYKYCRLAGKGTVRFWYDANKNGVRDADEPEQNEPYWVWHQLHVSASGAHWGYRNADGLNTVLVETMEKFGQKHPSFKSVGLGDISLAGVEKHIINTYDKRKMVWDRYICYVGIGAMRVHVAVSTALQVGRLGFANYASNLEKNFPEHKFAPAMKRVVAAAVAERADIATAVATEAIAEAAQFEKYSFANYYWDVRRYKPSPSGLTLKMSKPGNEKHLLNRSYTLRGEGTYRYGSKGTERKWSESYRVYVQAESPSSKETWADAIKEARERYSGNKGWTCRSISIGGVEWAVRYHGKVNTSRATDDNTRYSFSDEIIFTKKNVLVRVTGRGNYVGSLQLQTRRIATSIALRLNAHSPPFEKPSPQKNSKPAK